jgi:malate permease and related proteins
MTSELFIRFFPLFLLLGLGLAFRRTGLLSGDSIASLKALIVNGGLPAVLFLSFLTMEIRPSYVLLFVLVFLVCLLLLGTGKLLERTVLKEYPLSRFFFSGFEFGMVGVALFTSLFGMENLPRILLLGLGHEFFIWFVYAPLLESQNRGAASLSGIVKSFFTSPIILAILTALILNITGLYGRIAHLPLTRGVISAAEMLSKIVTPLILLVIGSELQFDHLDVKGAAKLILLRLVAVSLFGLLLGWITSRYIMALDRMALYAFIIFFLIPPPFIIPVFLGKEREKENRFFNNLLVLYTPVTLVLLMIVMAVIGV